MNIKNIFKRAIILDFFTLILALLIEIFIPSYEIGENTPISSIDIIAIVFLFVYLYNLYLLYNFKSLGKTLYFPLLCFSLGITFALPLEHLNISNHLFYILEIIGAILTGVILTFIYYTDIKLKFES